MTFNPDPALTAIAAVEAALKEDNAAFDTLFAADANAFAISVELARIAVILGLNLDIHGEKGTAQKILDQLRAAAILIANKTSEGGDGHGPHV